MIHPTLPPLLGEIIIHLTFVLFFVVQSMIAVHLTVRLPGDDYGSSDSESSSRR